MTTCDHRSCWRNDYLENDAKFVMTKLTSHYNSSLRALGLATQTESGFMSAELQYLVMYFKILQHKWYDMYVCKLTLIKYRNEWLISI